MKSKKRSFLSRFSIFGLLIGVLLISHTLYAGNAGDFNSDNYADILWKKDNGKNTVKLMDGSGEIGSIWVGGIAGWNVEGIDDFNGDNKADILWRKDTGACVIWLMDETGHTDTVFVGGKSTWHVKGTGDFDADGNADILWQKGSENNNTYTIWTIEESGKSGYIWIGEKPNWSVEGVGDFNADGKTDILWKKDNGKYTVKLMDGSGEIGSIWVGGIAGWYVEDSNDFNGDGKADILWRKDTGAGVIWLMDEIGHTDTVFVGGKSTWSVESTGDFDGDGNADIFWKKGNGTYVIWTIDENGKKSSILIGTKDTLIIQPPPSSPIPDGASIVKKTEQVKSYDENGDEVTDATLKDDGFYQIGVVPSYTRNFWNSIVTDNVTGLMWQDDSGAKYTRVSFNGARNYCEALTLGGYHNWRVPTIVELLSIAIPGKIPHIDTSVFLHTELETCAGCYAKSWYWSSTVYPNPDDPNRAWKVQFKSYSMGHYYFWPKDGSNVRCVRTKE